MLVQDIRWGVDETLTEMEVEMSIHPNTIDQSVLLQAVVLRRCNSEVSQELKNVYLLFCTEVVARALSAHWFCQ
jgi:hypothetical protein